MDRRIRPASRWLLIMLATAIAAQLPALDVNPTTGRIENWGFTPFGTENGDWGTTDTPVIYSPHHFAEANDSSPISYPDATPPFTPYPGGRRGEDFDIEFITGRMVNGTALQVLVITSIDPVNGVLLQGKRFHLGDVFLDVEYDGPFEYSLAGFTWSTNLNDPLIPGPYSHDMSPGIYLIDEDFPFHGITDDGGWGATPSISSVVNPFATWEGAVQLLPATVQTQKFDYGTPFGAEEKDTWIIEFTIENFDLLSPSVPRLHITVENGNDSLQFDVEDPEEPEPVSIVTIISTSGVDVRWSDPRSDSSSFTESNLPMEITPYTVGFAVLRMRENEAEFSYLIGEEPGGVAKESFHGPSNSEHPYHFLDTGLNLYPPAPEICFYKVEGILNTGLRETVVQGFAVIDNVLPYVGVLNNVQYEGHSGNSLMPFDVLIDPNYPGTCSIAYTAISGSASSGSDFIATAGSLVFPPGVYSQRVFIPIIGDTLIESNEEFTFKLHNPVNMKFRTVEATSLEVKGTILNDDPPPPAPAKLEVVIDGVPIASGDGPFSLGTVAKSSVSSQLVVRINNRGGTGLVLNYLRIPEGFAVIDDMANIVLPASHDDLIFELETDWPGLYQGTVTFDSSDLRPYYFTIEGGVSQSNASQVWLDFNWSEWQLGLPDHPFNSLDEAIEAVHERGTVLIAEGKDQNPRRLQKPMRLKSISGPVRLGAP